MNFLKRTVPYLIIVILLIGIKVFNSEKNLLKQDNIHLRNDFYSYQIRVDSSIRIKDDSIAFLLKKIDSLESELAQ